MDIEFVEEKDINYKESFLAFLQVLEVENCDVFIKIASVKNSQNLAKNMKEEIQESLVRAFEYGKTKK